MMAPSTNRRSIIRRLRLIAGTAIVAVLALAAPAAAVPSENPFELVPGSFHITPSTDQAGAHEELTTTFDFAHNKKGQTFNDLRDTVVNLPPGFVGNNSAVPTCTQGQLVGITAINPEEGNECPAASQVGTITLDITAAKEPVRDTFPVYNMEVNSFGVAAELGFRALLITSDLEITVRPGDSGLTISGLNIPKLAEARDISVTIWALPADPAHDPERGRECYSIGSQTEGFACYNGGQKANIQVKPFLSNPTSCGPFTATMRANSWEEPENWSEASTEVGPIGECDRVPFNPSIGVSPTTTSAESPSGLEVSLNVPQRWSEPFGVSTSDLKDTVLALPVGYTINPSAGSGLGVCAPRQYEAETSASPPGAGCPPESKLGSVEVETPVLLNEKLTGSVYIAKPFENPFDSLLALYIVVKDPARGIIVKLAGHIEANPTTGQLTTTFDENPQVPFSRFTLKLHQGATSPLVSPPACGTYTAMADLTAWSAPLTSEALSSSFPIGNGIGGGACPAGGVPPFHPGLAAGTLNNNAGAYTPLDIHITRNDGEQEITGFSSQLPPGLTANLSGVPFCSEADLAVARTKSGAQEETEPSCPLASEIGHTLVGAGVGSVLAYTPGKVYLAGPFEGAPFSIASVTSAKVGPFDLGTVVVHLPLFINPQTAAVSIPSGAANQIPHIIDGIIIHVRDIRVYIERHNFMINPTNCNPMNFSATVVGGGADPANPADDTPVTTNDSFQLANCQNLQFKPKFSVSTSGKTSKAQGASLTAKLTYPVAVQGTQANIARVKVDLPKQLPSRLTTLQKACTAQQFNTNPAGCPAASFIGHARAITPILPVPLEGPAIFVSHGGEAFPSLEIVLQGYGVTIDLVGSTFISKAGITSSTFKTVPDQPVTSFELTLPQGPYSALAANGNLCTSKLAMPTEFVGQNGVTIHQSTSVNVTGCAKTKALTRAQKLAKALKACNEKAKKKRAACRAGARKRYDTQAKKKTKAKKK
jgi:hypothetical protein